MMAAPIDLNATVGPWPHGDHEGLEVDELLSRLDRLGIGRAVVSSSVSHTYDPATGNRRLLEEIAGHDRLLPCFVLSPLETGEHGDPARLGGDLRDAGVRVVRVLPRDHGWSLAGPESVALFRELAAEGLTVLVDLAQTTCEEIDALATREPELPIVVCRSGYRELRRLLALLARHPRVVCDLSYFGSHEGVEELVDRFGADRVLFGTGMPACEPGGALARLRWAGVTDEARAAIAHGNAERLLGLGDGRPDGADPADPPVGEHDVVDVHGHLGRWLAFWIPRPEASVLVSVLDRCGVRAIACSSLLGVGPDTATGNRQALAAAEAHPGRIFVWLVASPHRPQEEELLEHQLDDPRVVGIKIHPDTHTCPVDDYAYRWVFRLAERRRRPVLAHSLAGTPWSDPLRFDAVAEAFPTVRVVLAHAGVTPAGFRRAVEVCGRHPALMVDTCGSYITGEWIRRLVDGIGADRVLYGSDAPFIDLRYGLGRVLGAGLPDADARLVLGANARALLGIGDRQPSAIAPGGPCCF